MFNGVGVVLGCLFIGLGIALSGAVTEHEKHVAVSQQQAACWDQGTTSGLAGLATQEATPLLKSSFPDGMPQRDQDAVTSSFSVQLSEFSYLDATGDGGTIHCNASSGFSYTRADGSTYTNTDGNVVSYEVHPSKSGWTSQMSANDLPTNVFNYVAPPAPPAPPPAPPPVPVAVAPAAIPPEVADFDQGHADRLAWENWVNNLSGLEKQGAVFWSAQRSLANPEDCAAGASDAAPDNDSDQTAFQNACNEATTRLAASDMRRKSDPLYKAGWNSPLTFSGSNSTDQLAGEVLAP